MANIPQLIQKVQLVMASFESLCKASELCIKEVSIAFLSLYGNRKAVHHYYLNVPRFSELSLGKFLYTNFNAKGILGKEEGTRGGTHVSWYKPWYREASKAEVCVKT